MWEMCLFRSNDSCKASVDSWIQQHTLTENKLPTTGWYNTHCVAGAGGLTSSVSTLFPEEAVNEVKRQAMSELQKAVSEAERKAHEMISSERAKMERTVAEAKRQAAEDALSIINQQEDSSEVGTCADNFKTSKGVPWILQTHHENCHQHPLVW